MCEKCEEKEKQIHQYLQTVTEALEKEMGIPVGIIEIRFNESSESHHPPTTETVEKPVEEIVSDSMNKLIEGNGKWEHWMVDSPIPYGYEPPYHSFSEHYERKLGYVREENLIRLFKGFMKWEGDELHTIEADNNCQLVTSLLEDLYERSTDIYIDSQKGSL